MFQSGWLFVLVGSVEFRHAIGTRSGLFFIECSCPPLFEVRSFFFIKLYVVFSLLTRLELVRYQNEVALNAC